MDCFNFPKDSCDFCDSQGKEVLVWYLGHSGWAVRTSRHLLIFDYTAVNQPDEVTQVSNLVIEAENLPLDKVYVFTSHEHDDHYDPVIHTWQEHGKNIRYILGLNAETCHPDVIYVQGQIDVYVDDVEIHTIPATDDGVGFLVRVDGLGILHLGDHANWVEELDDIFKEQIDYLASKQLELTLAFIPIAKGNGTRNQSITEGARYAIEQLKPEVVFPMHGGSREHLYREFASEVENEVEAQIICATTPGNSWRLAVKNVEKPTL